MYNRLRQNEKILVDDTLSLLIAIRTKLLSQSAEIVPIDAEIERLCMITDTFMLKDKFDDGVAVAFRVDTVLYWTNKSYYL